MKIAETHEWARLDGDVVSVGITAHAVEELGDVVFIELPEVGDTATAGESFGEIESVKAASELVAPCDGEIVAVNTDLDDDYDILKSEPYGPGWMIQIKPDDASQLDALMSETQYEAFLQSE